jgi:hypothetical protein
MENGYPVIVRRVSLIEEWGIPEVKNLSRASLQTGQTSFI